MPRFRLLTLLIALSISSSVGSPLPGQPDWNSGFDGQRALQHIRVLASDSLRGRYSGFAGADKADAYIIKHFESLGLEKPFGKDGYKHLFTYGAGEYAMPSGLVAKHLDGTIDTANFWRDLNIFKYSGFGKVDGRVVLVGYGVSAPELGWDDYAGIDVKGAIVLAWRGMPSLPNEDFGEWGASGKKSTTALEKGAVGFIMCETDPPKYATIMEQYYRENMPAVWVSKSFADKLLKETGKTKDDLKKLADSTRAPVSQVLTVSVDLQVSGKYYPRRKTLNLAGMILGSDPALKNEIILIGAHMDHHGVDAAGNLYPGADDNASGTSTMMELARIFSEKTPKPKRTIMFMGFAAEEEGLVGSKAFVDEMRLPRGMSLVGMLNMDMVGQGNCSLGVGGIDEFPILGETMFVDWPDSALKPLEFWHLYQGSDHTSFQEQGIPAYVIGARGDHPNYHTPGDSAGNIKPEVMKAVGDLMFHCALSLADYQQPMKPMVNKAEWLVRANGGVRHERFDVTSLWWPSRYVRLEAPTDDPVKIKNYSMRRRSDNEMAQEFAMIADNRRVEPKPGLIKGVEYPQPLTIIELEGVAPSMRRLTQGSTGERYRAIEFIRERTQQWGGTFLADSTQNETKINPFTGVSIALSYNDFPEDTLDLKALAREGVGFVVGDIWANPPTEDGYQGHIETHYAGWRGIAHDARRAEMRCWLEIAYSVNQDWNVDSLQPFSSLWKGQVVCDLSQRGAPKEHEVFLNLGWFLIVRDIDLLKSLKGKPEWKQLGIPSEAPLVEELLKQGFSSDEIGDLLFNNLQRTLQKWWADESYRTP